MDGRKSDVIDKIENAKLNTATMAATMSDTKRLTLSINQITKVLSSYNVGCVLTETT